MISDARARSLAYQLLAHLTSTGPAPDLCDLDHLDAEAVAYHLGHLSGRPVALTIDPATMRAGFHLLTPIPEDAIDVSHAAQVLQDLDDVLERWASQEDGDEEAER